MKKLHKILLYMRHTLLFYTQNPEKKFTLDLHVLRSGSTVFKIYRSNFKTLCARRMDRSNSHYEDPKY
jgi:hypothetical protein